MKMESAHPKTFVPSRAPASRRGFTLIEVMVVVGIMGMVLAMGVPSIYNLLHKEGFRKTVNDIAEVCKAARARAIVQGVPTQVVFYPREGRCEVAGGNVAGRTGGLAHTAQVDGGTTIDMLDVNLTERKEDDIARVNFYPEGTCDEMLLILRSDRNEQRGIQLEITTGLARVLNTQDLQDLRSGRL